MKKDTVSQEEVSDGYYDDTPIWPNFRLKVDDVLFDGDAPAGASFECAKIISFKTFMICKDGDVDFLSPYLRNVSIKIFDFDICSLETYLKKFKLEIEHYIKNLIYSEVKDERGFPIFIKIIKTKKNND